VKLARGDKEQRSGINLIVNIVDYLSALSFLNPDDFIKGVLMKIINIRLLHFIKAGNLKFSRIMGLVDEMTNGVKRKKFFHLARLLSSANMLFSFSV
jgi:hypothetical protein